MARAQEFANQVVDLLESFGPCAARRMFGGFGIFHHGLMFGLIADGNLYLKADPESKPLFESEGSEAFSYYRKENRHSLSYYLAPEAFFEDPDACLRWAKIAFDTALRNQKKQKKPAKKPPIISGQSENSELLS